VHRHRDRIASEAQSAIGRRSYVGRLARDSRMLMRRTWRGGLPGRPRLLSWRRWRGRVPARLLQEPTHPKVGFEKP